jgi:hypothetical protein
MEKNTDNNSMEMVKNARGFSLAEVVVAMAMLTVTVGGVMMLVSDNSSKNIFKGSVLGTSACVTEANRILSAIQEKGSIRSRFTMNTIPQGAAWTSPPPSYAPDYTAMPLLPSATTIVNPDPASANQAAAGEAGIANATRWSATTPVYDLSTPATAPIIRPQALIMGNMTALQAIYHSDKASFCTAANGANFYSYDNSGETGTAFNTIFTDPTNLAMDEVKEYIKIEPFNTSTGAIVAGCPDVEPRPARPDEGALTGNLQRPPGLDSTVHPNSAALVAATIPTSVRYDRGFLVTVKVAFKDRAGRNRECQSQERFQYNAVQPKNTATLTINDIEASINDADAIDNLGGGVHNPAAAPSYSGTDAPYLHCSTATSPTPVNYRQLNVRVTGARAGSIMLCRDLSVQRSRLFPSTGPYNVTYNYRHTFYSTELMRSGYYSTVGNTPSNPVMVAGLYFPVGTNYYCLPGDGCTGWPFVPATGGTSADFYTRSDGTDKGYPSPLAADTRYYYPRPQLSVNDNAKKWAPCERINPCGGSTMAAGHYFPASGSRAEAYHLQFSSVPEGCDVHIQVAEVDAAYNITATEVRAYMLERPPGNKICHTGGTPSHGLPANSWYYSCMPGTGQPVAPDCNNVGDTNMRDGIACCMDFPRLPSGRPAAYPYLDP